MKKIIVVALTVALVLAAGCKRSKRNRDDIPAGQPVYTYQGEVGTPGGTLVLELQTNISTLNVITATDNITTYVLWYHLYRCLIDFRNGDDPPQYDPGLCTSWESNADATQWTFHLRPGVQWSDGEPFTADDVLFTYDVIRNENVPNAIRDTFNEGIDVNGKPIFPDLVKIDDHTVQFNLHRPNGMFLDSIFNMWLVPKHKWESALADGTFKDKMTTADDPANIVGLGPFRFKEHTPDQSIVLERNPYFWKQDRNGQRLPYLDRLIFVIGRDATTINNKFQAGEIDVTTRVRAEDFGSLKGFADRNPGVAVLQDLGVSYDTQFIAFNQNTGTNPQTGQPYLAEWKQRLFRNQKFRQAVSYAIDREGLANTVFVGRAVPIYTFVTPADVKWYSDDIMKYPYDPARARALLAEIGLRDRNHDGILEDQYGNTIEFNIITNSSNSQRVKMASFIANNLRDVGLKVTSTPIALSQVVEMSQSSFNYDALVLGWGIGVPPGPLNTTNILLSSGLNHVCFPSQKSPSTEWEAEVNRLVQELPTHPDFETQKKIYAQIQRIWSEQLPEINLVAQKEAVAYYNKFGNIRPSPLPPRVTWNVEEIYEKK
ncbi:MAG TPA: ABC transporter substrate-binding protein [Blastocatellia bacterium]|nr:ABC transporter substrate-binding protein [Blastocatellia bacterium]